MRGKAGIRPDLGVGEALGGAARGILQEARDALDDRAGPELAAEHWPLDGLGFAELAAALAAGYRRARKAVPPDFSAASAEELHELRKRVIVHRYQMELFAPLWPRMTKAWIAEAQRLRERLGSHHDLGVLDSLTAAGRPLSRWRARFKPAIAARQAAPVAGAAKIAGRLFAEKPKTFGNRHVALFSGNQMSVISNQA